MIEYVFPKRVADSNKKQKFPFLLKKQPLQIGLSEKETTEFLGGDYVVLDFSKEMCGGLRILAFLTQNTVVRIRFGESITECSAEIGEKNATNDHSLRDFTAQLPSYSDMTFGNTGFRFVRIDFLSGKAQIKSFVAENHILKKQTKYRYGGKDKEIKAIYTAAKRTIDLCASGEYVWDGVKRDRLVWIGDMHPETLALTTLYGRMDIIERSLSFVRDQTPLPKWMNGYPMYSMWWIIIVADYFEKTGAKDFALKQMPYLSELVKQLDSCVLEDGTLNYPSYFVDWPTHGQEDEIHGVRAINILCGKKAIELLKEFSMDTSVAERMLAKLYKIPIMPKHSKQVTALKFFVTELTEEDKIRLTKNGAQGMSTFMGYYILKAVASFDKTAATNMMKEYYGAMLKCGATTFFEDFDIAWAENSSRIDRHPKKNERDIHGDFGAFCYKGFRHSLCHGWAAGVLAFIKEEIGE